MNARALPTSAHPLLRHLRYRLNSRLPRFYPGAITHVDSSDALAVTIDDGPSPVTRDILRALRDEGLRATFFLTGSAVLECPRLVRAIRDGGHAIGSHGHNHDDLSRLPTHRVADDIRRGIAALVSVDGTTPTLFRPPYGRLHPRHRRIVEAQGCRLVLWSSLPGDYDPSLPLGTLHRRLERLRAGDILVLHDREATARRAVSSIHHLGALLRDRGLRTVTL